MNIGKKVLELRKARNLTQEQVAEALSVSTAAVSKWETQAVYPDIEMLPKIAGFFNVSIDMLLDYKLNTIPDMDDVIKEASLLASEEKRDEAISLLLNALHRFPNDYKLKFEIARHKFALSFQTPRNKRHGLLNEAIELLRDVIGTSNSASYTNRAKYIIAQIYSIQQKHDKTLQYLNELIPENGLYPRVTKATTLLEMKDENAQLFMLRTMADLIIEYEYMNTWLIHKLIHIDKNFNKAIEYAMQCIRIVLAYTNDKPDFLDNEISTNYEACAYAYAKLGDYDKCLESLENACKYSVRYDQHDWSLEKSLYETDESPRIIKTRSCYNMLLALDSDERTEYEPIRNTEKYNRIIETLKQHA